MNNVVPTISASRKPTIVLLHGLARTQRSMAGLGRFLEQNGYETWATTYPSRRLAVYDSALWVKQQVLKDLPGRPLFAVTHSLGGILVRILANELPWTGAIQMAPPNQGSVIAARFRTRPLFRWFYGPAGQDVSAPADWPHPPRPYGIIAGTRSRAFGNPTSWVAHTAGLLPKGAESDGTVLVRETKLLGMDDFVAIDASHTWIMNHPECRRQILSFLRAARFNSTEVIRE